jgi:hypothetical protein
MGCEKHLADLHALTTPQLIVMWERATNHPLASIDPGSPFREQADRVATVLDERASRPADAANNNELAALLGWCNDRSLQGSSRHTTLGDALAAEALRRVHQVSAHARQSLPRE